MPLGMSLSSSKSFKDKNPLEKRLAEATRIRAKYPDRVPIIAERRAGSEIPDIDKCKYLVPSDLTFGQFVYVIRKRIRLTPEKAIFVFVNGTLPQTGALVSRVYKENRDKDGFLYVVYSDESTFGAPPRRSSTRVQCDGGVQREGGDCRSPLRSTRQQRHVGHSLFRPDRQRKQTDVKAMMRLARTHAIEKERRAAAKGRHKGRRRDNEKRTPAAASYVDTYTLDCTLKERDEREECTLDDGGARLYGPSSL